jgi:hypothetical protein
MQALASPGAVDEYQWVLGVDQLGAAPLLVLHYYAGRAATRVLAEQDDIGPFRRQRQPVLDQGLHLTQARFAHLGQQGRDAALPAHHFRFRRRVPELEPELLCQVRYQRVRRSLLG